MKRLGKLNLVPCKKNLIRLLDLSLELCNIIKSDAELFKKEHTIPNVNITLNKQKMIFSKIWYLFNATTSITGEWWYEYMPLIECELLTSTWQACIQKGNYAAACLGLYYQCLRLCKVITKKIAELENKKDYLFYLISP